MLSHRTAVGAHGSGVQSQSMSSGCSGLHSAAPHAAAGYDATTSGASHMRPSAASNSTSTRLVHGPTSSNSSRTTTARASRTVRTGPQSSATASVWAPQSVHDPARQPAAAWSRCVSHVTLWRRPAAEPTSSTSQRHDVGPHGSPLSVIAVWRSHTDDRISHSSAESGRSAATHGASLPGCVGHSDGAGVGQSVHAQSLRPMSDGDGT